MEIEIEKIIVKSNPRKDFGDMDELTASVKEKGVIEPVIVKSLDNGKFELIAGERRLRAAKSAGLKKIPCQVYSEGSESDIEEIKLIENIHRKDFNPVEEAEAFKTYLDSAKHSIDTLSKRISKSKMYIQRRLELLNLPDEIQKSLCDGKIQLGHALMLARIKNRSDQKKMLKEIVRNKMGVTESEKHLKYDDSFARLEDSVFDTASCKGCRHNGGEQALLFESGTELKGLCLNRKCFLSKTSKWKRQETAKLKKDGVKVLSPANIENVKVKERVSKYDDDYKKILSKLSKEPENYAVVFEENHSGVPVRQVYCLNPKARRPAPANDKKATTKDADERLKSRVYQFKRNFLIEKSKKLIGDGMKESKAMVLYSLMTEACDWNDREKRDSVQALMVSSETGVESYGGMVPSFTKILALDQEGIEQLIIEVSSLWVKNLGAEIERASIVFGVDLKKHFLIDEDFLKLHTKDQLISLSKEIGLGKHLDKNGIYRWDKSKRSEMIDLFLNSGFDLKNKIPRIMKNVCIDD